MRIAKFQPAVFAASSEVVTRASPIPWLRNTAQRSVAEQERSGFANHDRRHRRRADQERSDARTKLSAGSGSVSRGCDRPSARTGRVNTPWLTVRSVLRRPSQAPPEVHGPSSNSTTFGNPLGRPQPVRRPLYSGRARRVRKAAAKHGARPVDRSLGSPGARF